MCWVKTWLSLHLRDRKAGGWGRQPPSAPGMKGREEVLVSGQRMENVPQKPGRWGSMESCCGSGDLGPHLLPISTFARGGPGVSMDTPASLALQMENRQEGLRLCS